MTTTAASPYATTERPEIHGLIPGNARRILDVGCNDGSFGAWLQSDAPGRQVWGVEPNPAQAEVARASYAGVVTGLYPDALAEIDGNFDCITFNHVLECTVDPWAALAQARNRLTPGGRVIAVIPNVRYLPVMADLAFRGRWEYQDAGILDRTHLRFFTRASIAPLFNRAGLMVENLEPINRFASVSHPALSRVAGRVLGDVMFGGFAVRAVRAR